MDSVEALRAECDRLRAELDVAKAEIADLANRRESALNRIDWVLDSLNSLPEAEA